MIKGGMGRGQRGDKEMKGTWKAAWVKIKDKKEESENSEGREETMGAERIEGGRKRGKCQKMGGRQPRGDQEKS
jgi:hypothetical protein